MSLPSYVTPRKVPYFSLEVKKAFESLTPKERLYAHYFNTAAWCGFSACSLQLSMESLPLLKFFYKLFSSFSSSPVQSLKSITADKGLVTEDEYNQFMEYFALLYSNAGNYLSFGDSKFIPACDVSVFQKCFDASGMVSQFQKDEMDLFEKVVKKCYSADPDELILSYKCTSYYSPDMSKEEINVVNNWMTAKRICPENTRVFKEGNGSSSVFKILLASADVQTDQNEETTTAEGEYKIAVSGGDYNDSMKGVVENLKQAQTYAANNTQKQMLDHYIQHFTKGNLEEHKESQKCWVKDKNPSVETNIGFIESYRDPSGVRAEWEGFVAIVNKDQSAKYNNMVEEGEKFIAKLPWGKDFEKEKFVKPDFTSLDVLGFASSGLPAGICIPNYDEVKRDFGFKNVYLANVVAAINFSDKMNHLTDEDWALYKTHFFQCYSVNVGVHELLGHGTGKLFVQNEDGKTYNFDYGKVINPLTKKPVETFYKSGETWGSMFGAMSSSYEECRAEAVALYLGTEKELLSIFGIVDAEDQRKTIHLLWLNMVRAGLAAVEFYSTSEKQWLQAHMRARYAILQTLLKQPNSIIQITHDDSQDKLEITIDEKRILSHGMHAISDLLCQLNINKSICDVVNGTKFYEELTIVDEQFLKIRETVMRVRKPRKQFVQPHTKLTADGKDVELLAFEGSLEGAVESFVTRHRDIPL